MCVVTLQLNDPLEKVVILKNNHQLPSEQQQHSRTEAENISSQREAHGLFVHHHQQQCSARAI